MGANAQTSVPAFTAGQVLTAQQQTEINTGIPVFATTTTRDAAFGSTGEKALAEGQFAYIEASNATQYYDGAAWQTLGGGLTLVKTQTIGSAVSSVTVTNAFSASYENYKIILSGGTGSIGNIDFSLKFGASAASYNWQLIYGSYSTSALATGASAAGAAQYAGVSDSTAGNSAQIEVQSPFLAKYTTFQAQVSRSTLGGTMTGVHQVASSYTDFTITASSGTLTGGTIFVYGYQLS